MKIKILMNLASIALLAGLLTACSGKEPVKIGFIAGTSGRVADLGVGGRNGVTLAVDHIVVGDDEYISFKEKGLLF